MTDDEDDEVANDRGILAVSCHHDTLLDMRGRRDLKAAIGLGMVDAGNG